MRRIITRHLSTTNGGGGMIRTRREIGHNLDDPLKSVYGVTAILEGAIQTHRVITGYSFNGFFVNDVPIEGPVILTKKLMFKWKLSSEKPTVKDLKIEDFELFNCLDVDLILLGTGKKIQQPSPELLRQLRLIAPVEVVDSVNAGATFNLINAESRNTVAALLPVLEWTDAAVKPKRKGPGLFMPVGASS